MPYLYHDNLQTNRLCTRFVTPDDVKLWTEFYTSPEATEYFPPSDLPNEEKAKQWINRLLDRYAKRRYGLQALHKKDTNEFVGQCGLLLQEVDGVQELEVGYHILRKHWGNGYAPEAAKRFLDHAFENNLTESVISIIDTRNIRSQRVADKNGLIREKQTQWMGLDVYVYRMVMRSL